MNALMLETNALKACVQTSPTHTTSYQQLSNGTYLVTIGTHLRKWVVAITLSYSPPNMVHPQVIDAKAFSAGLGGLQVG